MSFVRSNHRQKRNAEGEWLCKVCEGQLSGRRTSYCSDECAFRNDPGWIRRKVFKRDKGICAECGLDTESVERPRKEAWSFLSHHRWEADHIVPVSEGGGLCGLDGYRTLCKGAGTNNCHGKATGELRKRLNARKRIETAQKQTGRLF